MQKARGSRLLGWLLFVVLIVVLLDQWSKAWIRASLTIGESWPESGVVRLTRVANTGSAFGLFTGQTGLLIVITVIVLAATPLLLRYLSQRQPTVIRLPYALCLGLVVGGAVGNLIDRLRFGFVTDFVDVRLWHGFHWPAFNVADASIVVGTFSILVLLARTGWLSDHHQET